MTVFPKQQDLVLVCEVRRDAEEALRAELASLAPALSEALGTLPSVHFARALLLPAGSCQELLVELGFDGELSPQLSALWLAAAEVLTRLFRHCHSVVGLPTDADSFLRFCELHARRASAGYAAHDGLGAAVIQNDAVLDRLLQTELDRVVDAESIDGHGPLEIALTLQARARAHGGIWLGSVERHPEPSREVLEPVRERLAEVVLAFAVLLLLEIGHLWARLFARQRADRIGSSDASLLREQGPIAQVLRLKPGRLRLRLVKLLLWLLHGWLGQSVNDPAGALSHLHSARWLVLPGSRLLFLADADLGPGALLSKRSRWERRLSALIWLQTQDFPGGLGFVMRADRREAALRDWLRGSLLPTAFWYSAYPGLSVLEIERNHRVRELLGRELTPQSSRELCALL